MTTQTLYVRDGHGDFIPAEPNEVLAAAKAHLNRRVRRGAALTSPDLVRSFLAIKLGDRDCEYFCVLCLDTQRRFLRFVELFRGTLDTASVHPREVVRLVLAETQTSAVLLVHNHPSQSVRPSAADQQITKVLVNALGLIGVHVLDHLLVAGGDVVSFAELGLL
ncbi:MAG: JAB domain-containing protein [Candidatus Dormibacteria bacterium]